MGRAKRAASENPTDGVRRRLLARREELLRRVVRIEDDLRWLGTNVEAEQMEEGQEENIARLLARLDDREQEEIEAIHRALGRIAVGEYGRCTDCGGRIAPARLRALPATERCRPCAARR